AGSAHDAQEHWRHRRADGGRPGRPARSNEEDRRMSAPVTTAPLGQRARAALIDAGVTLAVLFFPAVVISFPLASANADDDTAVALACYIALGLAVLGAVALVGRMAGSADGSRGMQVAGTRAVDAQTLAPLG